MKAATTKSDRILQQPSDKAPSDRTNKRLRGFLLVLIVLCWPFLYLFNHVFPINGRYTAIGNDFIQLYYLYKVYLLAGLAEFHLPLWSPSEAAGFAFYANPFAAVFYPFNLLLLIFYKIFDGYSPLDHQSFTVFGISIFALGLFMWLKSINKNIRAVLFATLVMSVSFKVTEIIRFPNAIHTAAWLPWVLYAMTQIMLSGTLKKAVKYGILLIFFLICLCTAGYPYYDYYSQFLFAPYLLVFFIKPLRIRLIGSETINWKRALLTLTLTGVATALICGPYILGIKQLMSQTMDRGGKNFSYSTQHTFSIKDTAGSLVYPPASNTEGWYFFSITALLIILLYLFLPGAKHQNPEAGEKNAEGPPSTGHLSVKLFFLIWFAMISYISFGRDSYLFIFLWKYWPGFASLRVWARLNIILVSIIAWLLSLAYARFENEISGRHTLTTGKKSLLPLSAVILFTAYIVILCLQLYFYLNNLRDEMWTLYFEPLSSKRVWFIIYGFVAVSAILLSIFLGRRQKTDGRLLLTTTFVGLLALVVLEMRPVAVNIWSNPGAPVPSRIKLDIEKIDELSFRYARTDVSRTITLSPAFNVGVVENWYFNRYVKFLKNTENEPDARKILLGVADGTKVFFSESIQHPTVLSFLKDASRYKTAAGRLVSYNGDELQWEIETPAAGYLSFIDNWAPGWKAWVDDKPTEIELLFGTFKAVSLSPGRHQVRFVYQPGILPAADKNGS